MITPDAPHRSYSTRLRTAVVFTGSGTAGAYQAGVLRALHEAGVKIDIVAGRGIGATSAAFSAIDGGARLWEPGGLWNDASVSRFYGWRQPLVLAGYAALAGGLVLLLPLALLAAAVLAGLIGLALTLVGFESAGRTVIDTFTGWVAMLFAPDVLPTIVPRLVLFTMLVAGAMLAGALVASYVRDPARRRSRSGIVARLFGSPLTARPLVDRCASELWNLIRGAAPLSAPAPLELARKYVELLSDNLGQPGFRELLLVVHDMDARRDMVFALLKAQHRGRFFAGGADPSGMRRGETFDLAGVARDHALDAIAAAVAPPLAVAPHLVRVSPEGPWRGEAHRLGDRPDALTRVLEETAHAGAEQVILVSAAAPPARAHELSAQRADFRGRAGEQLASFEAASLRDVLEGFSGRFAGLFVIRPAHNPVTPLDLRGVYDERSDRRYTVAELVDRGYQDAYRQFIEPVVGAGTEPAGPVQRMNGAPATRPQL